MSEIFAKRLKSERELKGWTQEYLAGLVGVTNGAVSGYERNYREPDMATLSRIANLLDVSTDYLLGRTDIKKYPADLAAHKVGDDEYTERDLRILDEALKYAYKKVTEKADDKV